MVFIKVWCLFFYKTGIGTRTANQIIHLFSLKKPVKRYKLWSEDLILKLWKTNTIRCYFMWYETTVTLQVS